MSTEDLEGKAISAKDMKVMLSTLWVFVTVNYIYCDVFLLFGNSKSPFQITESFLLGAAILMEIPMAMILLSRILKPTANRLANIITGVIMTIVQTLSLFVGIPTLFYLFFSFVEIASTSVIFWYSWEWQNLKNELA